MRQQFTLKISSQNTSASRTLRQLFLLAAIKMRVWLQPDIWEWSCLKSTCETHRLPCKMQNSSYTLLLTLGEVKCETVKGSILQWSEVDHNSVQFSPVRFSAVQCSAVQCSAVQCSAVQCSAVQCSARQFSAVQCSAVQRSAVQHSVKCSAVCSGVQCSGKPPNC